MGNDLMTNAEFWQAMTVFLGGLITIIGAWSYRFRANTKDKFAERDAKRQQENAAFQAQMEEMRAENERWNQIIRMLDDNMKTAHADRELSARAAAEDGKEYRTILGQLTAAINGSANASRELLVVIEQQHEQTRTIAATAGDAIQDSITKMRDWLEIKMTELSTGNLTVRDLQDIHHQLVTLSKRLDALPKTDAKEIKPVDGKGES